MVMWNVKAETRRALGRPAGPLIIWPTHSSCHELSRLAHPPKQATPTSQLINPLEMQPEGWVQHRHGPPRRRCGGGGAFVLTVVRPWGQENSYEFSGGRRTRKCPSPGHRCHAHPRCGGWFVEVIVDAEMTSVLLEPIQEEEWERPPWHGLCHAAGRATTSPTKAKHRTLCLSPSEKAEHPAKTGGKWGSSPVSKDQAAPCSEWGFLAPWLIKCRMSPISRAFDPRKAGSLVSLTPHPLCQVLVQGCCPQPGTSLSETPPGTMNLRALSHSIRCCQLRRELPHSQDWRLWDTTCPVSQAGLCSQDKTAERSRLPTPPSGPNLDSSPSFSLSFPFHKHFTCCFS